MRIVKRQAAAGQAAPADGAIVVQDAKTSRNWPRQTIKRPFRSPPTFELAAEHWPRITGQSDRVSLVDFSRRYTGLLLVHQREAEVRQRLVAWQQLHERATLEAQAELDRYRRSHEFIEHSPLDQPGDLPQELRRLEE